MTDSERARCLGCGSADFERVEDASDSGAVTGLLWYVTEVRLEYHCTACGEQTTLIPPGRDEPYLTRE